jgi:hypothetical protein
MLKQATDVIYALLMAGMIQLQPTTACAATGRGGNAAQASIRLTLSKQIDSAIRLEARQAPLAQILKEIAGKTQAVVHYSVLPEAPVTATCVGANVAQIMECLVGKQIGLVAHKPSRTKPAEFWLLGSSVGGCQAVTCSLPLTASPGGFMPTSYRGDPGQLQGRTRHLHTDGHVAHPTNL